MRVKELRKRLERGALLCCLLAMPCIQGCAVDGIGANLQERWTNFVRFMEQVKTGIEKQTAGLSTLTRAKGPVGGGNGSAASEPPGDQVAGEDNGEREQGGNGDSRDR